MPEARLSWERAKINHKAIEAVGLALALFAWISDLYVQGLTQKKAAFLGQLEHMVESFQHYDNRERIVTETLAFLIVRDAPKKMPGSIYEVAWDISPAFRESWWDTINTEGLWLERITMLYHTYADITGIGLPASLKGAMERIDTLHTLLNSHGQVQASEPWENIKREDIPRIVALVDTLSKDLVIDGSKDLSLYTESRRQKIKWFQVVVAGMGALLMVFGKCLGWRLDLSKETSG